MIVSIGAAADLGSRIFLALTTFCIQVKARYLFLIGVIATILFRCGTKRIIFKMLTQLISKLIQNLLNVHFQF